MRKFVVVLVVLLASSWTTDGMTGPWPQTITAARLTLRPFTEGDKPVMVEMMSSEQTRRYLGGPSSREDATNVFSDLAVGVTWGSFAVVTHTGDVAGSVSFDDERGELEASWELLPQYWGRGYAQEAVTTALSWAFATTEASRIIAVTQTANEPSCRLALRLGMQRVATL